MASVEAIRSIMGNCNDNDYCRVRDVLRDEEVVDFQEHMGVGGCSNNGGECPLYEIARQSGVPDREFLRGGCIAIFAFNNGIELRKEARKRWALEGHAEKFEAVYDRGVRDQEEIYRLVMNEGNGNFFG